MTAIECNVVVISIIVILLIIDQIILFFIVLKESHVHMIIFLNYFIVCIKNKSCQYFINFVRWLIKAMRDFFFILFPQYNILFPQFIILFPQERYFVPTTLLSCSLDILFRSHYISYCSLNILLLILINYPPEQRPPIL